MSTHGPIRILQVDGNGIFASCEIALNPDLQERAIWVGGGRHGDGIVIVAHKTEWEARLSKASRHHFTKA